MAKTIEISGLRIDEKLYDLMRDEIAPGTGVDADEFWQSLAAIVRDLGPKNRALLEKRDELQNQIDRYHLARKGEPFKQEEYTAFLKQIGYLVEEGGDFQVRTAEVDPEITVIPGAQLVVPLDNARYALNAANARWGSLYDALYGTDVISEDTGATRGDAYNPVRGDRVIEYANRFLDEVLPLTTGSHADVTSYRITDGVPHAFEIT